MEQIDRKRIAALAEAQQEIFRHRTPRSAEDFTHARRVMAKGLASSAHANDPWPVFIARGLGSRAWDVDDNEYVDFHNGNGVMAVGHANPKIGDAVKARIDEATHFGASVEISTLVATELGRRFRLPKWCFSNSGTEAVSDAVRIARAATGRDVVLKVEGGYHGDSDAVMSSVYPSLEALEARAPFEGVPFLGGIPTQVSELSRTIRYNDLSDLEAAIDQFGDRIAALIMEPVMTNINVVQPREGYLERVKQLTAENGIKLVFDEVKTGATIAPGGVVSRFGVTPDMVAIAKASFGGYPGGALGISAELAEVIESGAVSHMGTFNGNPLTMTAAITTLTEVLTDAAYERFEEVNENLLGGCRRIIDQYELPAYTEGLGAKGSVIFSSERLYDYRDYLSKVDVELSRLAWFYLMNHGVLIIPGTETDWTLSVAHGDDEVELYVETFEAFARDVRGA